MQQATVFGIRTWSMFCVTQNRTIQARNTPVISWVASLSRAESGSMKNQHAAESSRHVEWEVQVQGTNGTRASNLPVASTGLKNRDKI